MYKSGFQTTSTYLSERGGSPDLINPYELDTFELWSSARYTSRMAKILL